MLLGRLMKVENYMIDISEIPFKERLDKNVVITIIKHKELRKGKVCLPFERSVYSIDTWNILAVNHYLDLQKNADIQKMIEKDKLPRLSCKSNHEGSHFTICRDDNNENPTLICAYCCREWGKIPDEVTEIYANQHPRHKINVPIESGKVWIIFNQDDIEWKEVED